MSFLILRRLAARHLSTSPPRCAPPNEVRVRFAPSPTGYLHLGGLRTALYNYLFARGHAGTFILRIEDTDQTRLVPGAEEHIQSILQWSGLGPDEGPCQEGQVGPYRQSERLHIYQTHIDSLVKSGSAYHCFCTEQRLELLRKEAMRNRQVPRYDNRCRHLTRQQVQDHLQAGKPNVIRLRLELSEGSFDDLVYGRVRHNAALSEGDLVLMKSDGFPTYHFANVVDDHLMRITHVLRGMEWLSSTQKHLSIYKALGWSQPKFAHLPLLLNKDGSKLSKRQGSIFVQDFKDAGFLPEALVNFITFCGSGFETNKEIRTMLQLIQQFSLSRVSTHSAVLDMDLLLDVNRRHVLKLLDDREGRQRLVSELRDGVTELLTRSDKTTDILSDEYLFRVLQARKKHMNRIQDLLQPDYLYLWQRPDKLTRNDFKEISEDVDEILNAATKTLANLPESIIGDSKELPARLQECRQQLTGVPFAVFMRVLRLALSNLKKGASVAEMISVLGKTEVLHRLESAASACRKR